MSKLDWITESRYKIMKEISEDEGINLTELSQRLDKSMATIHESLEGLIWRNIAGKDPDKTYYLTSTGEEVLKRLDYIHEKVETNRGATL